MIRGNAADFCSAQFLSLVHPPVLHKVEAQNDTTIQMKFFETHANLVALCALATSSSNAFLVNPPAVRIRTSLASTRVTQNDMNNGMFNPISLNTNSGPGINSSIQGPRPARIPSAPAPDSQQVTVPQSPDVSPFTNPRSTEEVFMQIVPRIIQGGSLKVCQLSEVVERVSVYLRTDGRPLHANVELWHGPDHTPQSMSLYLEDGNKHSFRAILESPSSSNTVAIRNTGSPEYPIIAGLEVDMSGRGVSPPKVLLEHSTTELRPIQGGAIFTKPFPSAVQSVQCAIKSDGRPIRARIELLQGPNNNKSVLELYTEDGFERPFYVIVDTPGEGNVVRIVNQSTVEFPMLAAIEPYLIDPQLVEGGENVMWD